MLVNSMKANFKKSLKSHIDSKVKTVHVACSVPPDQRVHRAANDHHLSSAVPSSGHCSLYVGSVHPPRHSWGCPDREAPRFCPRSLPNPQESGLLPPSASGISLLRLRLAIQVYEGDRQTARCGMVGPLMVRDVGCPGHPKTPPWPGQRSRCEDRMK